MRSSFFTREMCRCSLDPTVAFYRRIDNVKSNVTGAVSAFTISRESSSPWWTIGQVWDLWIFHTAVHTINSALRRPPVKACHCSLSLVLHDRQLIRHLLFLLLLPYFCLYCNCIILLTWKLCCCCFSFPIYFNRQILADILCNERTYGWDYLMRLYTLE